MSAKRDRSAAKACAAARAYADDVAQDNTTYVRAFLMALNTAREFSNSTGDGWVSGMSQPPVPSASLLKNPRYAANARRLYQTGSCGAVCGRALSSREHTGCVAIALGAEPPGLNGAMIAPNTVITAAHDLPEHGEALWCTARARDGDTRALRAERIVVHPDYDAANYANDIAVIVLADEAPGLSLAQLAEKQAIDRATEVRVISNAPRLGRAARNDRGWRVHVPVVSSACANHTDREVYRCHEGAELITGKPALGGEDWIGERGEPCYVRCGRRWRLAGIASRPTPGYHLPGGDGIIFVRVDRYASWIRSTIQQAERNRS